MSGLHTKGRLQTLAEKLDKGERDSDKQSTSFRYGINYIRKNFYNICQTVILKRKKLLSIELISCGEKRKIF
jgi:hypothetical protein